MYEPHPAVGTLDQSRPSEGLAFRRGKWFIGVKHFSELTSEGETKMFLSLKQCLNKSRRILMVCLAVVSCYSVAMSQAQSTAADLQGTVRDPKGAVVAGATVTVRKTDTNASRDATTNDDGFYKILSLPPGDYQITVKAPNYKTAVIQTLTLTVGQTASQDIPLEIGDVTATVTVTTAPP